jgi:hypothetical protein
MTTKIQLAFLLDTTASMQPWIDTCKEEIYKVIEKTRAQHGSDLLFEVALVAYNDYDDSGGRSDPIVVPFTQDVEMLEGTLAGIRAFGGWDAAEDVAGGMEAILNLQWDSDAVWHLVHLTDAPPHGREYHEPWVSDQFPNGDPQGRDLNQMLASLDVHYTFFRITENTDVFIKILSEYMGNLLTVIDLQKQEHDRMGVHMRVRELDDHTFSGMLSAVVADTLNPTCSSDEPADPTQ